MRCLGHSQEVMGGKHGSVFPRCNDLSEPSISAIYPDLSPVKLHQHLILNVYWRNLHFRHAQNESHRNDQRYIMSMHMFFQIYPHPDMEILIISPFQKSPFGEIKPSLRWSWEWRSSSNTNPPRPGARKVTALWPLDPRPSELQRQGGEILCDLLHYMIYVICI